MLTGVSERCPVDVHVFERDTHTASLVSPGGVAVQNASRLIVQFLFKVPFIRHRT